MARVKSIKRRAAAGRGARLMSLENERWMSLRKAADAVLNQVLCSNYRALGIAHHITEHGVQISAYSREHIMRNSDGAKSVAANLERRNIFLGSATARQKSTANHAERRHKAMFALESMHERWVAQNITAGFPVFEPDDKRLEAGFVLTPAITAAESIDAGLLLGVARGERTYDEKRLLEMAIRASAYATPHAEIEHEIDRQIQTRELVMARGELQRPADSHALDAAHTLALEAPVAPMASYQQAVQHIAGAEAAMGRQGLLSQTERDGVTSVIAGSSRSTFISAQALLSQPAVLEALQAAARTAGVDCIRLSPLAFPVSEVASVETALQQRGFIATEGALVVVEHAQALSARQRDDLQLRVELCNARLTAVYDPGHALPPLPALQAPERALRLQAEPIRQLKAEVEEEARAGGKQLTGHKGQEQGEAAVAAAAVERMMHKERVVVIASTRAAADRLNASIAKGFADLTGQVPRSVKTANATTTVNPKSVTSYKVGDTVLMKRATGSLRRKDVATVESVNEKAGFLRLSVTNGGHSKTISLSLSSQSHHISRIEVQEIPVLPGTVLRTTAAMHTLGLAEGQIVTVESVDAKKMLLVGQNGSEHQISVAGNPVPMSLAMARTPDEMTRLDRTLARVASPDVLVHLAPDSTPEEVGAALSAAYTMADSSKVRVHYDEQLLAPDLGSELGRDVGDLGRDLAPSAVQTAQKPESDSAREPVRTQRLTVRESDVQGMANLRTMLARLEAGAAAGGKSPSSVNLTLIPEAGARSLHKLRDFAGVTALGKQLDRTNPVPTTAQEKNRDILPQRPTGQAQDRK